MRQLVNGKIIEFEYDRHHRLIGKYLGSKATPVASLEYIWNADGTLAGRKINGQRYTYCVDKRGRLIRVLDANGIPLEQYRYDNAGNVLRKCINGKETLFTYDAANQLINRKFGDVVTNFAYDAAGRMITEGDRTYTYGWNDRVMAVDVGAKRYASYDYYADGQLASASYKAHDESYLWDDLALLKHNDDIYLNEPHAGGGVVLASSTGELFFNDILGTTLASQHGDAITPYEITTFGEGDSKAFFTGKPMVDGLGHAFLLRNYRAELCKWQTVDPFGYPDGWNNLVYCFNAQYFCFDYLGAVSQSITKDGVRYTWDWDNARITGFEWLEEEGTSPKIGWAAKVNWSVQVDWKCVRRNGDSCNYKASGTILGHYKKIANDVMWYQITSSMGIEPPTFNSILEGIGVVAATYLSGILPFPVIVEDPVDVRKLLIRPYNIVPEFQPISHKCKE